MSQGSYIVGRYENGRLYTFSPERDQLSAYFADSSLFAVNINNAHTYSIELPNDGSLAPPALIESRTDLILGILLNEENNESNRVVRYQLPFQLELNEFISVIGLNKSNQENEADS